MEAWRALQAALEAYEADLPEMPVAQSTDATELRSELRRRFDFRTPWPLDVLTDEVVGLLRRHAVHVVHPRYFGLFNPSVRQAGVVGDTLTAAFNPQLAGWSHAAAANELERLTLRALAERLGIPTDPLLACFTTGGAEANLSAVLVALAHRFPEAAKGGMTAIRARPALYISSESHHSFVKVARSTGLGTDALHEVPVDERLRLDPKGLVRRLAEDRDAGWAPLLVVGTAGTTGGGLIDPLPELADVCAGEGLWFHVDAAWGGAACLSPQLRPALRGIERADSVTWDAHKWLSVPMGAGMFFCPHPEAVRRAFAVSTSYMPQQAAPEVEDPYATTLQWSRRAIGLKVFLSLAELGLDGWGRLIEHQAEMGTWLRRRLRQAGYRVVNDTPLPLVCFTHPDGLEAVEVARRVVESGQAWISPVSLGGGPLVLRACITSFRTEQADLEALVQTVELARRPGTVPARVAERRPVSKRTRARIAFATDAQHADLTEDDRLAAGALGRRGIDVVPLVWSEFPTGARGTGRSPDVDAVILRSTWDYHLRLGDFLEWIGRLERQGIPLWNPPGTVRRNVNKAYLLRLPERGVPVIPTLHLRRGSRASLAAILERQGWVDAVIKPAVSGGAWNTWRTRATGGDEERFARHLAEADLLVQPYVHDVVSEGEWSLLFFDGRYSHAVLKRPGLGEFRVQEHFGGSVAPAEPDAALRAQAAAALAAANERTLYARVDGVVQEQLFHLNELELIEPTLFVGTCPGSAERFAQAVEGWLEGSAERPAGE
jgi:glutamate/tyrosine decarboxylase-like PLP-dependent enzyme/glutathione synthase/RimK-type ligase-like ATP-grasp enzyme